MKNSTLFLFYQNWYVPHPHTHQQNGSAERKQRHIIETKLSLLAQASMPLEFWMKLSTAATYLINHVPSKVINFETPLERLYHHKLDLFMHRCFS